MKKILIVTSAFVAMSITYTADDSSTFTPILRSNDAVVKYTPPKNAHAIRVVKAIRDKYGSDEGYNSGDERVSSIERFITMYSDETWKAFANRIQNKMAKGRDLLQLLIISNSTNRPLQLNLEKDLDKPVSETNWRDVYQVVAVFSEQPRVQGSAKND